MHVSMDRGRLYRGLQDRNTRIRGNMLGLSKTSIFRRCLAAWGKNQPTVYININEITLKQKLLQKCIIVSCNNHQCFRVLTFRTTVARDPKAELRTRQQVEPRGLLLDISHSR